MLFELVLLNERNSTEVAKTTFATLFIAMLTFGENLVKTLSFHTGLFHRWVQTEFALVTFLCQTSLTFFATNFSFPTFTSAKLVTKEVQIVHKLLLMNF